MMGVKRQDSLRGFSEAACAPGGRKARRGEAMLAISCLHLISQNCVTWPLKDVRSLVFNVHSICSRHEKRVGNGVWVSMLSIICLSLV